MVFSPGWSVAQQSEILNLLGAQKPGSNRTPTPTGVSLCGGGGWGGGGGRPPKAPAHVGEKCPRTVPVHRLRSGCVGDPERQPSKFSCILGQDWGYRLGLRCVGGPERQSYIQGCILGHGWGHRLGSACVGDPDQQPSECICILGLGWGHRRGIGG